MLMVILQKMDFFCYILKYCLICYHHHQRGKNNSFWGLEMANKTQNPKMLFFILYAVPKVSPLMLLFLIFLHCPYLIRLH